MEKSTKEDNCSVFACKSVSNVLLAVKYERFKGLSKLALVKFWFSCHAKENI